MSWTEELKLAPENTTIVEGFIQYANDENGRSTDKKYLHMMSYAV